MCFRPASWFFQFVLLHLFRRVRAAAFPCLSLSPQFAERLPDTAKSKGGKGAAAS